MNIEFFIARRLYFSSEKEKKISPPAIRIAIVSIALGLMIMILALAIVIGFKQEVRNKVIGFGAHIQITNFDSNTSFETAPIVVNDSIINEVILPTANIVSVQHFATKPGIMKTDDDFMGVIVKGVDSDYNWDFFRQNLVSGNVLNIHRDTTSSTVIISKVIADKMKLDIGDSFFTYFIQNEVRARKFHIVGIYQTDFSEYDKLFILTDIKQVRRLNQWDDDQVSGVEILINDYNRLDQTAEELYFKMTDLKDRNGNTYYTRSIKDLNPMLFAWLGILDTNVVVIILLMFAVACFSIISGLIIIILERANMIGILKSMGENNISIRKIFLYISAFIIGKGLFWGNLIGIGCCLIQKQFGIFRLDPESYYISVVPIVLTVENIVLLNIGTLLLSLLMLIGPSYLVTRIDPVKAIRFD
ncbi:MAG: ABC transporter permease [Dysgonamonadaceae bacterium]|jgi:lipoprotein-releasing system permease protein|nr:ABC transporter permease [Dysgonamonadaceae bacterium]